MRTSLSGINLIKTFEGERLEAYLCPAGVWTIGYGHTNAAGPPKVFKGLTISKKGADDILRNDLIAYEGTVTEFVKVDLHQHQFDALVSFCYNVGSGNFLKSSLLRKLNAGDYTSVPSELMKWNKAGGKELAGLTRRRRAEAALWRSIDEAAPIDNGAREKPDLPKPKKSIVQSREANTAAAGGIIAAGSAALEAAPHIQTLSDALGRPAVLGFLAIAILCAAIWYFRKQRLEENGE